MLPNGASPIFVVEHVEQIEAELHGEKLARFDRPRDTQIPLLKARQPIGVPLGSAGPRFVEIRGDDGREGSRVEGESAADFPAVGGWERLCLRRIQQAEAADQIRPADMLEG